MQMWAWLFLLRISPSSTPGFREDMFCSGRWGDDVLFCDIESEGIWQYPGPRWRSTARRPLSSSCDTTDVTSGECFQSKGCGQEVKDDEHFKPFWSVVVLLFCSITLIGLLYWKKNRSRVLLMWSTSSSVYWCFCARDARQTAVPRPRPSVNQTV